MPTGRVKWFSLEKGFGFIASDEGEDVYLAATALPEGVATVKPGTKLEFTLSIPVRVLRLCRFILSIPQFHSQIILVPIMMI